MRNLTGPSQQGKIKDAYDGNGVNRLLGYRDIEICSPEEVADL